MDRKYERVGREISTGVRLETDIYNPLYEHRVEFREPNMPPSCTMVAKVGEIVVWRILLYWMLDAGCLSCLSCMANSIQMGHRLGRLWQLVKN